MKCCKLLAVLSVVVFLESAGMAIGEPARSLQTEANVMSELVFEANSAHDDPFNTVTLDVVFTAPDGDEFRVPAFWAGGARWKVRYASPVVGVHRFRSECTSKQDAGLHGVTGRIEVRPYRGKNPHAVFLARRHLVDGALPSAALAG